MVAGLRRPAAGQPFETYVADAVLRPAGMSRTGHSYLPAAEAAVGCVRAPRIATPLLKALLPAGIVGRRHGPYLALRPFLVEGAG